MAGFENNPWSVEFWNLTEQGRYVKQYGVEVAKTKARQAGTKLGAPRMRPLMPEPLRVLVQRRDLTTVTIGGGGDGSSGDGPPT